MTVGAIIVDVEGTTTPVRFVTEVLFPFARAHLGGWIAAHGDEPDTAAALAALEAERRPDDGIGALAIALRLSREDRKVTPLKVLQGLVWEAGYARGELVAPVYDDVAPALRRWRDRGLTVAVYSSGSVHAQRLLFGHSSAGDLRGLFDAHFDTTVGAKTEAGSYARIAAALGVAPDAALFLSDAAAELDAARAAGLRAIGVARDGARVVTDAVVVETFAAIDPLEA